MILDHINNLKRYSFPHTDKILKFIDDNDCQSLPNEQIDINGKELFVRVMEYSPKAADQNRFETHHIYADLQYVVSGIELMQTAPLETLSSLGDYDAIGDYHFFKAGNISNDLIVEAKNFTIFYPNEAHRPACAYKNNLETVKKLVFKIKIN